jgi:hypothetical protein
MSASAVASFFSSFLPTVYAEEAQEKPEDNEASDNKGDEDKADAEAAPDAEEEEEPEPEDVRLEFVLHINCLFRSFLTVLYFALVFRCHQQPLGHTPLVHRLPQEFARSAPTRHNVALSTSTSSIARRK